MKEKERIEQIVQRLAPELKELSHKVHDNPEIGMEEYKACAWQVELIRKHGFEVEENYCGMPTAYRAVYRGKKPGPKIAFLSEYDALPEIGHGCGHNLICMIGVGAGLGLAEFADQYGGEVYIYGTPGEENMGAKIPMTQAGAFDEMDAVMEVHPSCQSTDSWNTSAIDGFMVEFFGKASHAAAAPENGVNALDAVLLMFNAVNAMRQQTTKDVRIHGVIHHGGTVPNVIPEYTKAEFYTRAHRAKETMEITRRVKACAEGAALATGCEVKFTTEGNMFKDTISNQVLSRRATDYMEELGYPSTRANGGYVAASSDIGDVSYAAPSIQLSCKVGDSPDGSPFGLHTRYFAERAGTDEAMDVALDYVKGLIATAIDVMTEPDFLSEIREEFSHVND